MRGAATYRVPPCSRWESLGSTAGVAPGGYVVQRRNPRRVQERVQESERALAGVEQLIVQERDDRRERRARRARTVDALQLPGGLDDELDALRGDVGVSAAGRVEQARVGVAETLEVAVDGVALVAGACEDVREPAGGEIGGGLGADTLRAPYSGDAGGRGSSAMCTRYVVDKTH